MTLRTKKRGNFRRLRALFVVLVSLLGVIIFVSQGALSESKDASSSMSLRSDFEVQDISVGSASSTRSFFSTVEGDVDAIAAALSNVPNEDAVLAFSLESSGELIDLPAEQQQALEEAVANIGSPVAFLLIDAESGQGIQLSSTEPLYAASSSKVWFARYLCQLADEGSLSLDDLVPGAAADYPLNERGTWDSAYCVGALLENSLIYSDNTAYETLRETYEWTGYSQWLSDQELDPVTRSERSWYPDLSPVISVQMWMEMAGYLSSDAPHAAMLQEYLASTEVSFLREALAEGDQSVSVLDKAGWDSGAGDNRFDAICDSGIVSLGGRTYFVSVLAQVADSVEGIQAVESLMDVLFEAANALG